MIKINQVSKVFQTRAGVHEALKDVTLDICEGDIFGIIGMSGAGKSTLVRCLNALETPSSGDIEVDGQSIVGLKGAELAQLRANVSMIFQNFNLFSQKTVLKNVLYPLVVQGGSYTKDRQIGLDMLAKVGLEDKADLYPAQLSGGQKQRVAIARALVTHPKYILCDEATSALDSLTTNQILKLLRTINRELGITLVIITHSMEVVEKICNKVAVIHDGSLVEQGLVSEVFASPAHEITARLLERVQWDAE